MTEAWKHAQLDIFRRAHISDRMLLANSKGSSRKDGKHSSEERPVIMLAGIPANDSFRKLEPKTDHAGRRKDLSGRSSVESRHFADI